MQSRHVQQFAAHRTLAQPFSGNPLALLAGAFGLGILGGLYFAVPISLPLSAGALSTLVAAAALFRRKLKLAVALLVVAMLFVGSTLASIEKNNVPINQLKRLIVERRIAAHTAEEATIRDAAGEGTDGPGEATIAVGEPVELTGVLERDPEVGPGRLYLFLKVQRIRFKQTEREVSGEVVLLAPVAGKSVEQEFAELDLRYGARIRVMTRLERSDRFRNPGVSSFTEYLDRKGYDATGFVKSPLLIERLENTRVFLPLAWLYEWRRKLQAEIDLRFSIETAGVLDAAFLGNRYNLSHSTAERFREGGTFHVLVISGLHITFLGSLVFLIAKRLTRNRVVQFFFPVVILWAYSVAVGAEPSVVRAALMFTVVLLAPLVSRRASSLNALGGVAIALLVWRPSDLLDPSFQLTFVSVLAIVTLAWPLLQKLSDIGSWRPTRDTPYPPSCAPWVRSFAEGLYWSERQARRELERANYSYRLFKAPMAFTLEWLRLQRLLRYGFGAVVVSAGVQLALLPFLIIYFHRLSLASFMLNIGVSLLMGIVAGIAAVGLLIAQLSSTLAGPFISAANTLNSVMVHSVDPFAKVGVASIRLPEYTGWPAAIYFLYYVPLTMLAVSIWRWAPLKLRGQSNQTLCFFAIAWRSLRSNKNKRKNLTAKGPKNPQRSAKVSPVARQMVRFALVAQIVAIALIVIHPWSEDRPEGKLRVDFLDVGQGDSALVTFPDNTTLLIDGGGRPGPFRTGMGGEWIDEGDEQFERDERSIGESVVSEYLWWRGLDHIDYILATHADADHIDGLNDVARNFAVRAALVARTSNQDPEFAEFSKTLSTRGIPIRTIGAGDEMRFGNVAVTVVWPLSSLAPSSSNNDSVVLRLQFGDRSILLTGDIEAQAEKDILESFGRVREDLKADVVKVGHHGSKSSSTEGFVSATHPSFAIISVGQTSMFGHPNRAVVERWKAVGSQVLTTGDCGMITATTDGTDLSVTGFIPSRGNSAQP